MKSRLFARGFPAMLLGFALLVPAPVPIVVALANANSDAAVVRQTPGGVFYVSGGVGTDSIDHLNTLAGKFNLKLVFALNSGSYVSDVKVAIADAAGTVLVDATSDGPWFLARLPSGNYQIVATLGGQAVQHQASVGSAGLRTVDFRWASE